MSKVTYVEAQQMGGGRMNVFAMVESSFIAYIAWYSGSDYSKSNLFVGMKNGAQYAYTDVPLGVWNKMMNAHSVGSAYNELVKNVYEGECTREPAKSEDVFA